MNTTISAARVLVGDVTNNGVVIKTEQCTNQITLTVQRKNGEVFDLNLSNLALVDVATDRPAVLEICPTHKLAACPLAH